LLTQANISTASLLNTILLVQVVYYGFKVKSTKDAQRKDK